MKVLFIGDIFGRPGREAVRRALPELRQSLLPDLVIANCENAAGGKGISPRIIEELFAQGVDVLTGGNHSFFQKGTEELFVQEERLLRPANFPPGTPGSGWGVFPVRGGGKAAVLNICGRAFMEPFDDFFRCADELIERVRQQTPVVLVDFHAEATSEKVAIGWHLDGRVSAIFGTHTHIPTADETILPGGTAHITDVGMTGPYRSVIGSDVEGVLLAMRTMRFKRFEVAEARDVRLCGALVEIDEATGRALRIERVRRDLGDL